MTELAVIVPTRSRPDNIGPIVEAWWQTGAFDCADLYFAYDMDDMQVAKYRATIHGVPEIHGLVFPDWMPLVPKLNRAALELAESGEYPFIAFMGDDHIPRTQRWAHMLVQDHHAQRDWIWYGQDGFQDQKLPTWWSMDSSIIKKLRRMVPAPVQHLYCDNAVLELGKKTGKLGYDERILIEHMHPFAGKAKSDAQYERVNRRQQYDRDSSAFRQWMATGLDQDAKILASVGG